MFHAQSYKNLTINQFPKQMWHRPDETGKRLHSSHVLKDVSIRNIKDENKGVTRESLSVPEIQVAFGDKNLTLLAGWHFLKTAVTH